MNEETEQTELAKMVADTHPWRVLDEMVNDQTDLDVIIQWLKCLSDEKRASAIRHSATFHNIFSYSWAYGGFTKPYLVDNCIRLMSNEAKYFVASIGIYYMWWMDVNNPTAFKMIRNLVNSDSDLMAIDHRFSGSEYSDFLQIEERGIEDYAIKSMLMGRHLGAEISRSRLSWMFLEHGFLSSLNQSCPELARQIVQCAVGGCADRRHPEKHDYNRMAVYNLLRTCLSKGDLNLFNLVVETIWNMGASVPKEFGTLFLQGMLNNPSFASTVANGKMVFSDLVFEMNMNPMDIEELDVFLYCHIVLHNLPEVGSEDAQLMDFFNLDFDWTRLSRYSWCDDGRN